MLLSLPARIGSDWAGACVLRNDNFPVLLVQADVVLVPTRVAERRTQRNVEYDQARSSFPSTIIHPSGPRPLDILSRKNLPNMARNQEKAQSMLYRFREAQAAELGISLGRSKDQRRPRLASSVKDLRECEKWRGDVLRETSRKVSKIQDCE